MVDAAAAVSANVPTVTENPMGDLREWVRLHRRAKPEPMPEPEIVATEVAALPAVDAPEDPGSPLLPNRQTLLYGTLPLTVGSVGAILITLGVLLVVRRIRLAS